MKGSFRARSPAIVTVALVAFVVHCGVDDDKTKIECDFLSTGKACECKPGRETLGFCSERVLGIPSVCCAQDGWPAADHRCGCDLVVCVSIPGTCKCSRSTQRLADPAGEEVAECPAKTGEGTRCCVDKLGNCGCYLRTADQCGDGATDVDKCDYFAAKPPCATAEHPVKTCEE